MYKEDEALNNLQWLICHKTPANYCRLRESEFRKIFQPILYIGMNPIILPPAI